MPTNNHTEETTTHTSPSHHHNIKLRLTSAEERLFRLLTNADEAHRSQRSPIKWWRHGRWWWKWCYWCSVANYHQHAYITMLHLCVFILPFHDLTFPNKKGQNISVTAQMIKEALKLPVRDIQAVSKMLSHVDEMMANLSEDWSQLLAAMAVQQQQETREEEGSDGSHSLQLLIQICQLRAGLLLWSLKEHWVTCLLTVAAWEIH